jgi:hypothetical protein
LRKILVLLVSILLLAEITPFVFALIFVPARVQPSGGMVNVPNVARDRAPPLVEPGTLEKTIFIHYAKSSKTGGAKVPTCYKLLGAKWKSLPINYVVNPSNSGLSESDVVNSIAASTSEWDSHTSATLFGTGSIDYTANWDSDSPDGRNEYSWGNYPEPGVIAITVVWSGIPLGGKGRQIIEYDVMFDTDYMWQIFPFNTTTQYMDLRNIATHETGHGIGLDDVYDAACSEVTMYGYSTYGEIIKRDLAQPDITGLQKLYGA